MIYTQYMCIYIYGFSLSEYICDTIYRYYMFDICYISMMHRIYVYYNIWIYDIVMYVL